MPRPLPHEDKAMFEKLLEVEKRYEALTAQMYDPNITPGSMIAVMREHAALTPLIDKLREYKEAKKGIEDAEAMLSDPDMKELAQAELDALKPRVAPLEQELKLMLLPKDPADDKDVIM